MLSMGYIKENIVFVASESSFKIKMSFNSEKRSFGDIF
jgi:hypothetical protein